MRSASRPGPSAETGRSDVAGPSASPGSDAHDFGEHQVEDDEIRPLGASKRGSTLRTRHPLHRM